MIVASDDPKSEIFSPSAYNGETTNVREKNIANILFIMIVYYAHESQ